MERSGLDEITSELGRLARRLPVLNSVKRADYMTSELETDRMGPERMGPERNPTLAKIEKVACLPCKAAQKAWCAARHSRRNRSRKAARTTDAAEQLQPNRTPAEQKRREPSREQTAEQSPHYSNLPLLYFFLLRVKR